MVGSFSGVPQSKTLLQIDYEKLKRKYGNQSIQFCII